MRHSPVFRVAWGAVLGSVACAPRAEPPTPSPLRDIVRRHWDQACLEAPRGANFATLGEILDTVGLGSELVGRGLTGARPGASDDASAAPEPSVDLITRYGRDGRLGAFGVWDFTVDTARALGATEVVRPRIRRFDGLLAPVGFRLRLSLGAEPRARVASPIDCLPHMIHEEARRPVGLPDSVTTWVGPAAIYAGNDSTVSARISLDERGRLTGLGKVGGSDGAFAAVREVVEALSFDPAVRNGEAVAVDHVQNFRFRRRADLEPSVADSLFLSVRGFERRRQAFEPLVVWTNASPPVPPSRLLAGVPGVTVTGEPGRRVASMAPDGCEVALYYNGAFGRDAAMAGAPGMDGVANRAPLTALELYGRDGPVAEPGGCGVLLLWSREGAAEVDSDLVGDIVGTSATTPGQRYTDAEVLVEPGGRRGYVRPDGRFSIRRLLPGRYRLTLVRRGVEAWSGAVLVRAGSPTDVVIPSGR